MPDFGLKSSIDLTTALPPAPHAIHEALEDAFRQICASDTTAMDIRRNRPGGAREDVECGALWLRGRFGQELDPERIVVTNGTQSALNLLFGAIEPGATLFTESVTYAVLRQLATRAGLKPVGLPVDQEGIIPEALEEGCLERSGQRVLFCNPTVHNPTTAVMGDARRIHLAETCRRHGITIIEDDVLGFLHPDAPPPIAAFAPDITWYCMSVSKCFAMGLRVAYLIAPTADRARELVAPVQRLSSWFPNALSSLTINHWISTGLAQHIIDAVRADIRERHEVASKILTAAEYVTKPGSLHIWVPLPDRIEQHKLVNAAKTCGILIRPAEVFAVSDFRIPNAVRVSLTAPPTTNDLVVGLSILDKILGRNVQEIADAGP
ncbi:PLP-dependent aminotransferase family protein [Bradyrhizobium sp. CB82]|uniref:aminotransferase-like domain-containing protein n=1 Tax=Bradyrhizobium sp. CB82 TaxID=3039159 RepID=UPI0024B142BD|nr:PLP-dependent aminotransferase family protein [Bradyrhizobium sp. CB82]WFU40193.1 PLP-dependent aminotransferase family protein [Bradyrhizobium sp. CB82]